jgi:tetratricopeptide (TPR) repeat protein
LKRNSILLLLFAALAAACNPPAPPPAVVPVITERYLIDPRIGYDRPAPPAVESKIDAGWRALASGDYAAARAAFADARRGAPTYVPALVGEAEVDIREAKFEAAHAILDSPEARAPQYTAARVAEAELAIAENQPRRAYDLYRALLIEPNAPASAGTRVAELSKTLFDQLYHDALSAPEAESIRLLREALQIQPGATAARILLVQKLVAQKEFEEARRELEPVLNSGEVDRAEVQEALAEIDAGRGRYQEAIVRYDRLSRRNPEPRYAARLNELKEQFAAANMPPQYRRARESDSITRADFAVLLYWKVASVRFAQNVGTPPIAIDVSETPGREELVRALSLGIFTVDPVTRRVGALAPVNAGALTRLAARVLALRGAACARPPAPDASKTLAACGVTDPSAGVPPETPVSGQTASMVLEQVDRALAR